MTKINALSIKLARAVGAVLMALVFLSGCATNFGDGLPYLYGKQIDYAIAYLGVPNSQQEIAGRRVYTWAVSRDFTTTRAVTNYDSGTVSAYGTTGSYSGTSTTYVPENNHWFCTLKIITNQNNTITNSEWQGNIGGCRAFSHAMNAIIDANKPSQDASPITDAQPAEFATTPPMQITANAAANIIAPSPLDDIDAQKVIKKARHGDAAAQGVLGVMYEEGRGVPHDDAEAVNWYRKSAEQGSELAQVALGLMYDKGKGVQQDYVKAVYWYKKSAEQGDAMSQGFLGTMYGLGQGVPRDYVNAYMWYSLAAAQGDEQGRKGLDLTEKEAGMTPEQRAEAQKMARDWLASHISQAK